MGYGRGRTLQCAPVRRRVGRGASACGHMLMGCLQARRCQAALQQLAHTHPHMPCRSFLPNRHAAERITQMGALEFVRTVAYW